MSDEILRTLSRDPKTDEFRLVLESTRRGQKTRIRQVETLRRFAEIRLVPLASFPPVKNLWGANFSYRISVRQYRDPQEPLYQQGYQSNFCQHIHRTKKQAENCLHRYIHQQIEKAILEGKKHLLQEPVSKAEFRRARRSWRRRY